jgi:hypothetical protein
MCTFAGTLHLYRVMLHPSRSPPATTRVSLHIQVKTAAPPPEPPGASGAAWRGAPLPGRCPRHAPPHDPQRLPASAAALLHPKPQRIPTLTPPGLGDAAQGPADALAQASELDGVVLWPHALGMDFALTEEAAAYISERGSRLFLWQEPVGNGWAADRQAFNDPNLGVQFAAFEARGVAILLAEDLEQPKTMRIRLDRLRRRLYIEWDGARWGRRGEGAP